MMYEAALNFTLVTVVFLHILWLLLMSKRKCSISIQLNANGTLSFRATYCQSAAHTGNTHSYSLVLRNKNVVIPDLVNKVTLN